jgi:hypothetical protein
MPVIALDSIPGVVPLAVRFWWSQTSPNSQPKVSAFFVLCDLRPRICKASSPAGHCGPLTGVPIGAFVVHVIVPMIGSPNRQHRSAFKSSVRSPLALLLVKTPNNSTRGARRHRPIRVAEIPLNELAPISPRWLRKSFRQFVHDNDRLSTLSHKWSSRHQADPPNYVNYA